jgi:hypothetical protein
MSRPIAYNASGPLSGSIRGGSVNYTVDSGNRDYTTFASKKWVPSADGVAPIVFVTDSYTQGITNQATAVPLFYSCNGTGSAAIIYTANRIPGSPGNYTDANVALNDLITARGYFILESNDPYQGDYQSGNLLDLDASKMSSYPQTGTNWYDLSGNDFDFSLVNGPSFQSGGWFNIDGTDDAIILTGNSALKSTNTLVVWLRTTDVVGLLLTGEPLNSGGGYYIAAYYPGQGFYDSNAGSPSYFIDTLATANPATPVNYIDGRFHMWEVKGLNLATWTTTWNFFNYQFGYQIAGDVAKIQMFNSSLTSAQSKQLYFGSPIVTDGLVFAVDANNIVSYPKSGTTWYGLTGSFSGSLVNGASFNPTNGGSIVFDGADDYVSTNLVQTFTNELTVETWYRGTKSTRNHLWNFYGNNLNCNFNDSGYSLWMYWEGNGGNRIWFTSPNFTDGNIHHLVFRHSGSVNQIYFDGQLLTPDLTAGTQTFTGVGGSGYDIANSPVFGGNIYTNRVYNRALSPSEILQNYQAEQYRFETPAGPVTNGLVLNLEADNLDSYPGTGTTWYDISGNGNNVAWLQNPVGGTNGNSQINWNQVPGGGMFNWNPTNDDTDYFFRADSTTGLPTGNPNYTIEIVASMLNNSNNWHLFAYGQQDINQSNGIYYNVGVDGLYKYYYGNDYQMIPNFSSNVGYGNNFHYVETYNPSTSNLRCYLNGTLITNITISPAPNITLFGSGRLDIGGGVITNDRPAWAGKMGICRIYNRTLSSTEVTQNYNAIKSQYGV